MTKEVKVKNDIKLTKIERDQDTALETFIHRLVFLNLISYDNAFSALNHRQCIDMKDAYYSQKK